MNGKIQSEKDLFGMTETVYMNNMDIFMTKILLCARCEGEKCKNRLVI